MKKLFIITLIFIFCQNFVYSEETTYTTDDLTVYSLNQNFGLKDSHDKVIVPAQYQKLIRLGKSSWIIQKNNKFGLIDCNGKYLVKPKYKQVERYLNSSVKLGNVTDFGLYNEKGEVIIPPEFRSIEPLRGDKFLTYKNYKYGIYSASGKKLLDNEFDYIYTPSPNVLRVKIEDNWYDIESLSKEDELKLPEDAMKIQINGKTFKVTKAIKNTGIGTGYGVVTATDYTLKIFSTISTSYEDTIDDLMLSHGAETVSIFMKLGWIPKFPFCYARHYAINLFEPNKSPLAGVRSDIKKQLD